MNVLKPIASIMTRKLITVTPQDSLERVREIFHEHNIHHIPVVRYKEILGILSKSDFLYFLQGFSDSKTVKSAEDRRLRARSAEDIMSRELTTIDSRDPIRRALELFRENRFHAIPVLEEDELVGIVTTHDVIKAWFEAPITVEDYGAA